MLSAAFCVDASAAEAVSYGQGVEGRAYKFDFPSDGATAKDRFLGLKIRLPAEPIAFPSEMDRALKFACDHHGPKLRRTAQSIHPSDDWTLRVRFDWVTFKRGKATVTDSERAEFLLSDCSRL